MPFGGGPRQCLGSRFAMLEGKVLAAAILSRFRLELTPELRERIAKNGGGAIHRSILRLNLIWFRH
jgi:cytochrome P450